MLWCGKIGPRRHLTVLGFLQRLLGFGVLLSEATCRHVRNKAFSLMSDGDTYNEGNATLWLGIGKIKSIISDKATRSKKTSSQGHWAWKETCSLSTASKMKTGAKRRSSATWWEHNSVANPWRICGSLRTGAQPFLRFALVFLSATKVAQTSFAQANAPGHAFEFFFPHRTPCGFSCFVKV